MGKENLREIIGYPGYLMDIADGTIWSYHDKKRKIAVRKRCSGCVVVSLQKQGKAHTLNYYRLWYACRNNISIDKIPKTLCVRRMDDGSLVLCHNKDLYENMIQKKNEALAKSRDEHFLRKEAELQLMRRLYESKDKKELVSYANGLRENISSWYSKKFGVKIETSLLLFDAALDRMVASTEHPSSMITDISAGIRGLMRKEAAKNRRMALTEYNDVIMYSRKWEKK